WGWVLSCLSCTIIMSAPVVFGFFVLAGRKHMKTVKSTSSTATYHCVYGTTIQCTSGIIFPASVHAYSPFNDVTLPDDTVAFVAAKAAVPITIPICPVLLEAFLLIPVPSNPSDDGHEQMIPDMPHPVVIGLGLVTLLPSVLAD
ncbi:hypothetical protein EDD16DRAFT_1436738, partial [Pisolithus croceorrhizus]